MKIKCPICNEPYEIIQVKGLFYVGHFHYNEDWHSYNNSDISFPTRAKAEEYFREEIESFQY